MNYCQTLLTRLKATQDGCSDYRVAKLLEITPQAISKVKTKGSSFSDQTIVNIAHLLRENPIILVAENHLELNDVPNMREFWQEVLDQARMTEIQQRRGLRGTEWPAPGDEKDAVSY